MKSSITHVVIKMASSWLAGIIARRAFDPENLRQAGSWAFGASFLAERMGDLEATNLLRDLDRDLHALSLLHGADMDVELGTMLERISGQAHEERP